MHFLPSSIASLVLLTATAITTSKAFVCPASEGSGGCLSTTVSDSPIVGEFTCNYPQFQNVPDGYNCIYSNSTGILVQDNDGFCPSVAANETITCTPTTTNFKFKKALRRHIQEQ